MKAQRQTREQKLILLRPVAEVRRSAAAEENEEGMAGRILTGAKTLHDALEFITVLEMLPFRIYREAVLFFLFDIEPSLCYKFFTFGHSIQQET
jgi:hypothetical protein